MLRVVLVDDEPFTLEGLSMIIDWKQEGFEIIGKMNHAASAYELIQEKKPDLVITDIKMPEMSGLELIQKVREAGGADPHFVILSGYNDFEYARTAIKQNCLDYLLKPINREELLHVLDSLKELKGGDGIEGQSQGVLDQIVADLKENYAQNLTLKDLSKKYFINSVYLGQLFKKQYGENFKDYLNRIRMDKAEELLLRTDMKIYEIAEMVGYKDMDYFNNKFLNIKGCSPSAFRKKMK